MLSVCRPKYCSLTSQSRSSRFYSAERPKIIARWYITVGVDFTHSLPSTSTPSSRYSHSSFSVDLCTRSSLKSLEHSSFLNFRHPGKAFSNWLAAAVKVSSSSSSSPSLLHHLTWPLVQRMVPFKLDLILLRSSCYSCILIFRFFSSSFKLLTASSRTDLLALRTLRISSSFQCFSFLNNS